MNMFADIILEELNKELTRAENIDPLEDSFWTRDELNGYTSGIEKAIEIVNQTR